MHKAVLLLWCLAAGLPLATGQKLPVPMGRFLEDSALLGDSVRYALWYRHHPSLEVVFPDSSVIPATFELLAKRYYPTRTHQGQSLDSAVYVLRSFELAPFLPLQLPVFVLENGDSAVVFAQPDSVAQIQLVTELPEPLQLAENNAPVQLEQQFNYLYLLAGLALGVLVAALLVLLFGKTLRRRYERYLAASRFRAFQSRYGSLMRRFERSSSVQLLEEAVTLWKNYLTDLEEVPINSFTTKEIAEFYDRDELSEVLKLCDRSIYGNQSEDTAQQTEALRFLRTCSVSRYDLLLNQPADVQRATA